MARRANKKVSPATLIIIGLVTLGAAVGGFLLQGGMSDPFRTMTPLDVPAYLENSNSLRGNTYKVEGSILNSLAWSPSKGRLFSIEVAGNQPSVIPLLFPARLNQVNLQKGQKFRFSIEVGDQGILEVRDLKKS